jgi:hypothetical protein
MPCLRRLSAALAIAVALSSVPGLAAQGDTAADFKARLDVARQQLETDFSAAIAALDKLATESIELRRRRALTDAEREVHRDVFLFRARGSLESLDNEKAAESLRELLRIDPVFSGQLRPAEQQMLVDIQARESGTLEVGSGQAGSQVFINDVRVGVTGATPLSFKLLPGEYRVRVEREGYQPATATARVELGATFSLGSLTPQLRVPPIAFVTDRDDVEILADNQPVGRTARIATLRTVLPGAEASALEKAAAGAGFQATAALLFRQPAIDRPVTIRFRRDCFVESTRTFTLTSAMLTKLKDEPMIWLPEVSAVRMQADLGTIRVNSQPSDADVLIDGQLIGRTPFEREVCAGRRSVRVRHRIGSFSASVNVTSGRMETINAVLRPNIALLGAVDMAQQGRLIPELDQTLRRAFSTAVAGYGLASRIETSTEIQGWGDTSAADLVSALDRGDTAAVSRLLRLANESFDAPLLVVAARRPAEGSDTPVDLLVFWSDHPGVDRIRWSPSAQPDPAPILAKLDQPTDVGELAYQSELEGILVADTKLADAPLIIVHVADKSNAASAGFRVGDGITAIDGAATTAAQLAERVSKKRPGELMTVTFKRAGAPPQSKPLAVQRTPRAAPVFDGSLVGNAMIAKLTVASAAAVSEADRAVFSFNLALARIRFGEWKEALTLLTGLGGLPNGVGIGPGAAFYFRARCHEELGELDRAQALYREASTIEDQVLTPDGATVGSIARRRLTVLATLRR